MALKNQKLNSSKIQPLLNYFENYWVIENSTINILNECVIEKKLKRKENILTEGEHCTYLNFVVKGILKIYHIDKNGDQHNLQFAPEGKWLTDFSSFLKSATGLYQECFYPFKDGISQFFGGLKIFT